MKTLIVIAALLSSVVVSAAELTVLSIPAKKLMRSNLTTRFEVNLQDGTAGVSLTAMKMVRRGRSRHMSSKTFEAMVPELALVDKTLVLSANGETVDCGTMGVTRIVKRPVLLLTGNCDVITKREGAVVKVLVVTK